MGQFLNHQAYGRSAAPKAPKAAMLNRLLAENLNVPPFWVYLPEGQQRPELTDLSDLFSSGTYAVRSASLIEDGSTQSFAGQFETVLDVQGPEALYDALNKVLSAGSGERVAAYAPEVGAVAQHVIVQQMVRGAYSGVAFSKNPLTGLNEVVIEAVAGRGDQLVDAGITPDRFVWRGKGLISSPDDSGLPEGVVSEIARTAARLEKQFSKPLDLEWSWDGETLWWLQARPITGLEDLRLYSNRISREVMPGMIKPLVWSINVPLVNAAWIRFLERGVGPTGLAPEDLAKQFAFRSYFNMTALGRVFELLGMPPDALEVMLGLPNTPRPSFKAPQNLIVRLPRMTGMMWFLWTYERRIAPRIAHISRITDQIESFAQSPHDEKTILSKVRSLLPEIGAAAELNIIVPVLANIYGALFRRRLERAGLDYSEIDLTLGMPDFAAFDPKPALRQIGEALQQNRAADAFIEAFLERFGHLSENTNDLALPTWRERLDHVEQMARDLSQAGADSGARNQSLDQALEGQGFVTRKIGGRAQRFQLFREQVSYHYARLYAVLRPLMIQLGGHFSQSGRIAEPNDIFFLSLKEVDELMAGSLPSATRLIDERQARFEAQRNVRMPEAIYSDDFEPLPQSEGGQHIRELGGVGASRGQAKGPLRILRDFSDFDRVEQGDIIVIPFSDVGWTPVFAKAGGVVSEAGGMLSHSAIVAREYGIPCIVSVDHALDLPDGAMGMIDGVSGTVLVVEDEDG